MVGLISNRDETNYRSEVSRLAGWCRDNNLSLNVEKTKEIVVDFRRVHTQHAPLTINGATVERASSTKFLGVHITEDLSWTNNTAALAKKAQQRLYFLRKLRRARANQKRILSAALTAAKKVILKRWLDPSTPVRLTWMSYLLDIARLECTTAKIHSATRKTIQFWLDLIDTVSDLLKS